MELPEVQDLFVFPSCGDESTSIGAAYHVYVAMTREMGGDSIPAPIDDIYYGPDFSDDDVLTALKKGDVRFKSQHMSDVDKEVAGLIASGEIVARCSGRMEFGARALGNRSILADPADQQSVRIINMMVKKRDFWMPFAPVILWEQQADYIVNPKRIKSPYMMLTFDTTDKRDDLVAALHQADFTARAQILERSYNPGYYNIIERFSHETDRSVLLNTSFNLHGYPVVCSPDEALWVFANSGLKYLALGNHLISKSS
jgi:carbamoyltransferase